MDQRARDEKHVELELDQLSMRADVRREAAEAGEKNELMIQIEFLRKQGLHRQAAHLLAYWPVTRDEPGASIVEGESLMLHSEPTSDAEEVEEAVDETEREDSADSNGDLESEPEEQGEEGSEVPVTGDCGLPVMLKLAIQEAFNSAVLKNGNAAAACEDLSGFTKHVMRVNSDPSTILTDAVDTSQMMSDAPPPAQRRACSQDMDEASRLAAAALGDGEG